MSKLLYVLEEHAVVTLEHRDVVLLGFHWDVGGSPHLIKVFALAFLARILSVDLDHGPSHMSQSILFIDVVWRH